MLIEQIIELQLRGPGPPCRTCTLKTGYVHDKQKSLRKIFEWIIIFCQNVARYDAPYFPLSRPNHLQLKFNSKMQDVKRVLDLNCK